MDKISVLLPSYQAEKYIAETIESIQRQTYTNWELIVSDDASADGTIEVVKKYAEKDSRIRYHRHEENLGVSKNRNFLLEQASGTYIAWQDSDDISMPTRFASQVAFLKKHQIDVVATRCFRFNTIAEAPHIKAENPEDAFIIFPKPVVEYPIGAYASLFFTTKIRDKVGGFHSFFNRLIGEDYYWLMKANVHSPVGFLDIPLYGYRYNPESLTNKFDLKKLLTEFLLGELFRQQKEEGTDWLEKGEEEKAHAFLHQLTKNKKLLAERYRIAAAKAVDFGRLDEAADLIRQSFRTYKWQRLLLNTMFYYFRKKIR